MTLKNANKNLVGSGYQLKLTRTNKVALYNETGESLKKYFPTVEQGLNFLDKKFASVEPITLESIKAW